MTQYDGRNGKGYQPIIDPKKSVSRPNAERYGVRGDDYQITLGVWFECATDGLFYRQSTEARPIRAILVDGDVFVPHS